MLVCLCAFVSKLCVIETLLLQIWVEHLGVYVWVRELKLLQTCQLQMRFPKWLCNFCGRTNFFQQADLHRHLYLGHHLAQCRQQGYHRLFHDIFSRTLYENMQHPNMKCACVCLCVCVCMCLVICNDTPTLWQISKFQILSISGQADKEA